MKRSIYFFALLLAFITGCCTHQASPAQLSYQDNQRYKLVERLENATVEILQKDVEDGVYAPLCAGVWITNTKFLSARHCAETEIINPLDNFLGIPLDLRKLIGVVMPYKTISNKTIKLDDSQKPYFAVVIAYDTKSDLVLFDSIDIIDHDIANIGNGKIFDGQNVLIVGHSAGMEYTVFSGMISKSKRIMKHKDLDWETIQISAPIAGGNSGGGAFDMDGNLLGICSFTRGQGISQSFFMHRDAIVEFLKGELVLAP